MTASSNEEAMGTLVNRMAAREREQRADWARLQYLIGGSPFSGTQDQMRQALALKESGLRLEQIRDQMGLESREKVRQLVYLASLQRLGGPIHFLESFESWGLDS